MKRKPSKWTLTYGGVAVVVGTMIGQSFKEEVTVAGLLGSLTGSLIVAIILFVINIIKIRSKEDKTPEFDERTRHNMFRFYAFSSNIFVGILFIFFSVFLFIEMESVPVFYMCILIFLYFTLSGVTSFIVSRR